MQHERLVSRVLPFPGQHQAFPGPHAFALEVALSSDCGNNRPSGSATPCSAGPADAKADRGGLVADRVAAFAADLVELGEVGIRAVTSVCRAAASGWSNTSNAFPGGPSAAHTTLADGIIAVVNRK